MGPLVCIVIPFYGQDEFLADCVRSALAQQYMALDVVVVDDASPGPSAEAILSAGGLTTDPRLRILRHETNLGLASARNTGLATSEAPLLLALDSDDMLEADFVGCCADVLTRNPEVQCVFTDFQLFGDEVAIVRRQVGQREDILKEQWLPGAGVLMRREIWDRAGGYPVSPRLRVDEDWAFWVGVFDKGATAAHISRPLYRYRRHAASMSSTNLSLEAHVSRREIYHLHRSFFDEFNAGPRFIAEGYRRSAIEFAARGERRKALRLALCAMKVAPGRGPARAIAAALLPRAILRTVRRHRGGVVT